VADLIDEAHELEEALRNEAIRRAVNQVSAKVNESGLCLICGEPINPRRLAVMPTAQTCVECVK
jgi:phage/conjugal plasmid C-4 type zinc finger TraR family protein